MWLQRFNMQNIRNINLASLDFCSQFNIISGANGSGKTSILEAIFLLGSGRSFRTTGIRDIIQMGQDKITVFGKVGYTDNPCKSSIKLGLEKSRNNITVIHRNEIKCNSINEIARDLPLQIINSDSFSILEAGPQVRRQFLDWGMFHVEPSFFRVWQQYKKVLHQRNALLKQIGSKEQRSIEKQVWDNELCIIGEKLDNYRYNYVDKIKPLILQQIEYLLGLKAVEISYYKGWRQNLSLFEALEENKKIDALKGITHKGPHRADIYITVQGMEAKDLLSRGQLKIFICGMLLARANYLYQMLRKKPIFLIDDLVSELDKTAINLLLENLITQNSQIILTGIETSSVELLLPASSTLKKFHLIKGCLQES